MSLLASLTVVGCWIGGTHGALTAHTGTIYLCICVRCLVPLRYDDGEYEDAEYEDCDPDGYS